MEAPEYLHFLVWAEDPYVVVHDVSVDPATIFLVEPYVFPRVGDAAIPDLVADATAIQAIQSPLYFQGGNVLIGDDFVLIGADYPANTIQHINDSGQIIVPPGVDVGEFVNSLYQRTFDPEREVIHAGTKLIVPQAERREITVIDAVADQMREFAECIASGSDPEVAGEQGRDVIAVLEAARISVAEHRPVLLADVRDGSVSFR